MANDPSLADLLAQRNEIDRKISDSQLAPAKAGLALLNKAATQTLIKDIEELLPDLDPSSISFQQLNNVLSVLKNVPSSIQREVDRMSSPPPSVPMPVAVPAE